MRGLTRIQTGLRVDRHLLPSFKQLCQAEGFGIGEAVEGFMEAAVQARSVRVALDGAERLSEAQKLADLLYLKTRTADLKSLIGAGRIEFKEVVMSRVYREKEVVGAVDSILRVLPRIENKSAADEASKTVEEAMRYLEEERRFNAQRRGLFH